ncbi:MAG: type II toxin-antitoxin system HicA family toxin [Candidatus Paceibacterota bacterium]
MSKITPVHWRKFEKFLKYVGCEYKRTKGDHLIYKRSDLKRPVVIPKDTEIPVFVIRNNLRLLRIDHGEYLEIMRRL